MCWELTQARSSEYWPPTSPQPRCRGREGEKEAAPQRCAERPRVTLTWRQLQE